MCVAVRSSAGSSPIASKGERERGLREEISEME
jgi:hypothetical protein